MIYFNFSNITNTELWSTVIAFLSANALTLLTMAILLIKNKIKSYNVEEVISKIEAKADIKLGEKYEAKAEEMMDLMLSKIDLMEQRIYKKLKLDSEEKKAVVEEKTKAVEELTSEIKELLTESGE